MRQLKVLKQKQKKTQFRLQYRTPYSKTVKKIQSNIKQENLGEFNNAYVSIVHISILLAEKNFIMT